MSTLLGGGEMRSQDGFSLMELVFVMAITGVVVAITVGVGRDFMAGARWARTMDETSKAARAGAMYTTQKNASPATLGDISAALYEKDPSTNPFGGGTSLATADGKLVSVSTTLPAGVGGGGAMGTQTGTTATAAAPVEYGVAGEAKYARKVLFGY